MSEWFAEGGATRGRSSDFSRIAARYDATRDLPNTLLTACCKRMVEAGILPSEGRVLDAGCGTGQVLLPLAALGYQMVGIDLSREMISVAIPKLRADQQADFMVGDVCSLPVADGSFDAAVVSKLLQHVQDWQQACRELIRVVRPGRCILQINERGAFGNAVRRHFARSADQRGFKGRYIGINPHAEGDSTLVEFMRSQGCQPVSIDTSDLRWHLSVSYREAMDRLRERLFAEFWYLPDDVFQELLASTQAWMEAQPDGADTIQHLEPYLVVNAFRTFAPHAR